MNKNFRKNVGIIIINQSKQVLIAKRSFSDLDNNDDLWQFPQGGIKNNESPVDALHREIKEELNLDKNDFTILGQSSNWLCYNKKFKKNNIVYDGQKQKWFFVQLKNNHINKITQYLKNNEHELKEIKFVSYWSPINSVIDFKKNVYKKALTEFLSIYNFI